MRRDESSSFRGIRPVRSYLSDGMRGKRPASGSGTVGGGKRASNVLDGSSRKNHRVTPAISASERNLRKRRYAPSREMADTRLSKWQGGWFIGFLVQ